MGGVAIADVVFQQSNFRLRHCQLFGDYNPGGKLSYTMVPADYVNQISFEDMNMSDPPGRTYRYYTGQVCLYNECMFNSFVSLFILLDMV